MIIIIFSIEAMSGFIYYMFTNFFVLCHTFLEIIFLLPGVDYLEVLLVMVS